MAWPVPEIPPQPPISPPRYSLWVIILLLLLTAGALTALFIGKLTDYWQILSYGVLPGLLLWMCAFGVTLNRFEQSRVAAQYWKSETEHTQTRWKQWSRRQLAIAGNVLLSPESAGMQLLIGNPADISMFPKRGRQLAGMPQEVDGYLVDIDLLLKKQFPGYRNHLNTIYVLLSAESNQKSVASAVYKQWHLIPEFMTDVSFISDLFDIQDKNSIAMILCLQHWPGHIPRKSSELISAQLITSPEYVSQHKLQCLAGLGRMMPLEHKNLNEELKMLFNYNGLDTRPPEYVWLSGEIEGTQPVIAQFAYKRHWRLPLKQPFHYIDLTFGPPGELSFAITLAMLAEAADLTSKDQLIISQMPQPSGWMCLITRELFS
ncbi:hypothetical protein [Acerihabitans arboris]|uniref:Type VI secretion protein n=1 Tax=Acerihabitans arboris TaxID=2691583 RepID=A0A845SH40_9GAMM|nr:hypothetical protein [Acerihabitans arboris]NDL64190.1 hypothetical protein [Acerihabitans arboris]